MLSWKKERMGYNKMVSTVNLIVGLIVTLFHGGTWLMYHMAMPALLQEAVIYPTKPYCDTTDRFYFSTFWASRVCTGTLCQ